MVRVCVAIGLLAIACPAPAMPGEAPGPVEAPPCQAGERERLLARPGGGDAAAELTCSLRLEPGDRVRRILIEGKRGSGVTLDCNGATIGEAGPPPAFGQFAVEIRSRAAGADPQGRPRWERPSDVTLKDCTILGHLRIWGMGVNGQGEAVRDSSHSLGHTERAQAAAPTRVRILDSRIVGRGSIPLYLAPGVTGVSLLRSRITGTSSSVGVYLDAESADNVIEGDSFDIETGREVIAVDGSARNRIADNAFVLHGEGGIRLYRNCGEAGTVRHQTPSDNAITGNRFRHAGRFFRPEAIVVGSREGWRLYCGQDAGYPFGSSLDDGDHAERNRLEGNREE